MCRPSLGSTLKAAAQPAPLPHPTHSRKENQNDYPPHLVRSGPLLESPHLPAYQAVPVTIERIEFQTFHPRPGVKEVKPVMYFTGKQKGLILTSTSQDFIRATLGDEITACYGKRVTLRPVRKTIAGRGVDTILLGQPDK
jgi:hypothetical protein